MNMEPIQRFLALARSAGQGRMKEVRMSNEEALALAASIGELLAASVGKLQPVEAPTTTTKLDGGGFR